ncbi:MAG: carboxypeptidase regulatory-like domain-containing protein [Opitutales bacterium]|nr:carboxypeptidase regulatory-like domain-containing protein [Opitutales bacterium]
MTTALTRLRRSFGRTLGATACFFALLALPASLFGQGAITTGNMAGRVVDDGGTPVANAAVTVIHLPTGSRIETTSRGNGTFNARSLRPGGPYVVEVDAPGFVRGIQREIFIGLDRAFDVTIVLQSEEIIELDEFVVTGSQFDDVFSANRMGAGSVIGASDIAATPMGDRNINSLLRLDPRVVYNRNPADRAISAGGISTTVITRSKSTA